MLFLGVQTQFLSSPPMVCSLASCGSPIKSLDGVHCSVYGSSPFELVLFAELFSCLMNNFTSEYPMFLPNVGVCFASCLYMLAHSENKLFSFEVECDFFLIIQSSDSFSFFLFCSHVLIAPSTLREALFLFMPWLCFVFALSCLIFPSCIVQGLFPVPI